MKYAKVWWGKPISDKMRMKGTRRFFFIMSPLRSLLQGDSGPGGSCPEGVAGDREGRGPRCPVPCGGAAWRQAGDGTVPAARLGVSPEHRVLPKCTPSMFPSLAPWDLSSELLCAGPTTRPTPCAGATFSAPHTPTGKRSPGQVWMLCFIQVIEDTSVVHS